MGQTTFSDDVYIPGALTVNGTVSVPSNSIRNNNIASGEQVDWNKIIHLHKCVHSQSQAADVVTGRWIVHTMKNAGTVQFVDVSIDDAPTGGDKAYTVDVRKSTGGGAWATILTATVSVTSSSTSRTTSSPTLASSALVAGDLIAVVVTASGSTGTQGKGLGVTVGISERSLA